MKQYPLFQVSSLVLFFLFNISEAKSVLDGIPGAEAEVWQDAGLKKFHGPWSVVRKANGENADYYYEYGAGAQIQDFEPSNEDHLPADSPEVSYSGEEADFQSNYGATEIDVTADDQSSSNEDEESQEDVQWPTNWN